MAGDDGGDDDLIRRVAALAGDPKRATDVGDMTARDVHGKPVLYVARPRATPEAVREAERVLGFALPGLLRRLYLEVGDGGFGPGYGLLGVRQLLDGYASLRRHKDEPHLREWYEGMLPLNEWGCGIECYVDCTQPSAPVIRSDPNDMDPASLPAASQHLGGSYWMESASLRRWLLDWLDGQPMFYLPYGFTGPDDPQMTG